MKTNNLTKAALIGAVYATLTVGLSPVAFGPLQFRVAEALKPLLFRSPVYLIGLVVGMVVGNFFSPFGLLDTMLMPGLILVAGLIARRIPNRWVACGFMATVTSLGVATVLHMAIGLPLIMTVLYVLVPEVVLYGFGELVWRRFDTK
jgi:uncharacterized membrane protein